MSTPNIEEACQAIRDAWPLIQNEFFKRKTGVYLVLSQVHRTPEEQFNLFKKGRKQLPSGEWVVTDKSQVVTNVDGYKNIGAHNYLPSRAIDVCVVDNQTGKALWKEDYYFPLVEIARELGLESGGEWASIKDWPHLQVRNFKDYTGA